jgi:uncharacterized protein
MQAERPRSRIIAACATVALAMLASACQVTGLPPIGGPAAAAERAARQAREGDHEASARSFEAAARAADEAEKNGYWLAAAGEWIRGANPSAAGAAVAQVKAPLATGDAREKARIEAEIALASGDAARAAGILATIRTDDAVSLETRARVAFARLRVPDAVSSLVARERLLTGATERQANQRMIVDGVRAALLRGADPRTPPGTEPVVAGWLELGRILADAQAGALGTQRRLQSWRSRYPTHPADQSLWTRAVERPAVPGEVPQQVALLLPLSGRTASAGAAVRDGFLAAYYDDGSAARPRVKVYDVAEGDAPSTYLQAIADGSDFVVGPLTREGVAELANVADGRATTLALNFLPDGIQAPEHFFQYALSPEDEARLAARRVVADGRTSGVTLAPQSEWGRRVQGAFAEELAMAGGAVVDQAYYVPSTADFNDTLRQLLRTSGQRGSAPRPDAQFIFVAAQPVHGRLIRTQLRFNYASALPMYATSDIYDPSGTGNMDLNGVIFPDMPWVLDPLGPSASARESAERLFAARSGQLSRLYAFGYDAFRLIGELRRLRTGGSSPLPGVTGTLSVDAEGQVRRELSWAQIEGGQLVPWPRPLAAPVP